MIHYALRCGHDHYFDEWFNNSGDYEDKISDGTILCPACGDAHIDKAIMAPNVSGAGRPTDSLSPPPTCGMGGCGGGMCDLD